MPDDRTPAPGPSEETMAIAARYADTFDLQRELAAAIDIFAARAVEAAVAQACRQGREQMREEAGRAYDTLFDKRANNTNQFTNGLLAGMTELINAIRALPLDPPGEPNATS